MSGSPVQWVVGALLLTGVAGARAVPWAQPAPAAGPARVHHRLEVRLDPERRALSATDRVRLACPCPGGFDLLPQLAIDRLVVDGVVVTPRPERGRVALTLDGGPVHEVEVAWHGTLNPTPDDRVPDGPTASPAGTYLPAAGWYPTFPVDRFTYELAVDIPAGQRAVTAGRLVAEEDAGGRWRARLIADGPAEDLSLFAGPWRTSEGRHGDTLLRTWLHDEVAELAGGYLDKVASYLALYEGWIGPYPYSAFHVASAPFPAGLGFPAMTLLGTQVVRLPFIRDTSLGHEVLHAWWGNGIGIDVREGNWAEGLTTFMADYTFVEWQGAEAAREQRLRWLRELALLAPAHDRPLSEFRARRHTASQVVGYHKAAMVFVMLRDRIGPDAFAAGVRRLAAGHRFRTAAWSDLRRAFEAASDTTLEPFFAQWLQRAGAPRLALRDVTADGGRVVFTVAQEPPAWTLDLPVVVETVAGRVERIVRVTGAETRSSIDVPDPPAALELDPDARVVRRLALAEVPPILRHVAFDPAATTIVAADDPGAAAAARDVAAALLEDTPAVAVPDAVPPEGPLLIVGTEQAVERVLTRAGLAPAPAEVAGRGSGRAWAARRPGGASVLVVSAAGADALRALARPLPHLGGQSWLVFEGSRAVARGVWPAAERPLRRTLPAVAPGAGRRRPASPYS